MQPETGPLHGYTVVELSTGIAGAYCAKLLADGGAQVIKVESPQGDPLRNWSASGAHIEPGSDGALFGFLACSKHSVVADPGIDGDVEFVNDLLASADAVVWSRGSTVADCDAFTPNTLKSFSSAPDRHVHHPVRIGGPVARSAGDRVHPAGLVRRNRRARSRITRPRTGIRRRAGR